MTIQQYSKFQELVTKLREIFQIDRPELDFGIYRILNARAGEVNDYLQNRLAEKVQAALSSGNQAACGQAVCEVQEKEAQYQVDALNPDTVPKMLELRQKAVPYGISSNEHENAVFSHLLAFFSRYYEQGDFISQRRYKGDTYAIPYAGEEVVLHWANKDQYYTKSGEHFSNYSFQLADGRTVHFRLVAADTAKDNRKDNDKERRFALVRPKTVVRVDENRDAYQEKLLPVEEVSGSDGNINLIIRLEYAAQPKGTKQEELVNQAVETVLADAAVKARWLDLGKRTPTEKNPQRTLLEKHLSDYTTKNTADYFIHKDLSGFLRRELDFYIKNEVMHLDDVQHAGVFADIEKNLRMIQCLRSIALDLIGFLAQLEDLLRGRKKSGETEFRSFQLSGPGRNKSRAGRPNSFYAVLIDPAQNKIMGFEPPPIGTAYPTEKTMDGYERRYPLSPDGEEKVWCRSYESAVNGLSKGEIVLSENGALKLAVDTTDKRYSLMSNWTDSRYNAGPHGTALVANMMGDREAFSYPKSIHTVRDAIEAMTWHITDPVVMDFFAGSATTGHAVIHLNREDGGKRKFILVEMGQYFEDITKPRLIKSIAAEEWNSGVMRGLPSNLSHCFQVLKIESYEDTLNNLQLRRSSGQQDLLNQVQQSTREDYLLNYLLNVESRGSLLSVEDFRKPFDYQLNVAVDSAGAFEPRTVDLVETFNYLIGLCVKHIDAQQQRGFVTVTGTLPGGETCLVLWRDCDVLDYEGISQLCNKLAINPADNKFDVVYINGDHNIPTLLTQTAAQGGATRVLKLRQIEPEFLDRMFAMEDI